MASVSNSDRARAIAKACLSATTVCYGRCIALGFAQHSCDSDAAGDALAQQTWRNCPPLLVLCLGSKSHRAYLSDRLHAFFSIAYTKPPPEMFALQQFFLIFLDSLQCWIRLWDLTIEIYSYLTTSREREETMQCQYNVKWIGGVRISIRIWFGRKFSPPSSWILRLKTARSSIAGEDQIGAAAAGLGLITGHGSDDD